MRAPCGGDRCDGGVCRHGRRQRGSLLLSWLSWLSWGWLLALVAALLTDCQGSLAPSEIEFRAETTAVTVVPGGSFSVTLVVICDQSFVADVAIEYPSGLLAVPAPASVQLPCSQPTQGNFRGEVTLAWQVRPDAQAQTSRIAFSTNTLLATTDVTVQPPGAPPPVANVAWQALGLLANVDDPSATEGPALVLDAAGRPLAAWVENGRVRVRRWDGAAWQTLGPGPATAEPAQDTPALALADDGAPVVAWTERRPGAASAPDSTQVQVRRWDGTAWRPMAFGPAGASGPGGPNGATGPSAADDPISSTGARTARSPALLRSDGGLLLAWAEEWPDETTPSRLPLRRWDGSAWVAASPAGPLLAPGQPDAPRLAALPDGRIAVAWRSLGTGRVEVAVDGAAWQSIGGFFAPNSISHALVHAPADGLLLAVSPSAPATRLEVLRWDGNAWAAHGSLLGVAGVTSAVPRLAMAVQASTGQPLLALVQVDGGLREFRVFRWNGSDWQLLGQGLPPLARSEPGTPWRLAIAGAAWPVLMTEAARVTPGGNDFGLRTYEFR